MDKIREEFEAWYTEKFKHAYSDGMVRNGETYLSPFIDGLWMAWKASRAALCVELPEVRVLDGGRIAEIGYELAVDDFERALESAGISYK